MSDADRPTFLVFSYFPLLYLDRLGLSRDQAAGVAPDRAADIVRHMQENVPEVHVEACLWTLDDAGRASPTLVVNRAAEVREHLLYWSENAPRDWFDLYVGDGGYADGRYAVVLHPNLKRSIDRQNLAYLTFREEFVPNTARYELVYQPLAFRAKPGATTFAKVRGLLGPEVTVYVIDSSAVNRDNPAATATGAALELGTFPLATGAELSGYVVDYLKEDADA